MPTLRGPAHCYCETGGVILWIDAQLPPSLAPWLTETFGVQAQSMRFLGLRDADDVQIFELARQAGDV